MYKIETEKGSYLFQERRTATMLMSIFQQENHPASLYHIIPGLGPILLWNIEKEADHVPG